MDGHAMRTDHSPRLPMALRPSVRRLIAVVALGLTALFVSATQVEAISVSSSATGTVALDASNDGMLDVTMTLQPTELELKLVVTTLRNDVAVLVAHGQTWNRLTFDLATGRKDTVSYRVKPRANGRATIAWNVRSVSPTRYHASGVYQVDITGVPTPPAPPAMTTRTANQVMISEVETDRWHEHGAGGGRVDHVIGDSNSVTYQVSLETDEHGVCPQPATVQISVSGRQSYVNRNGLTRTSELGIETGDTVTDSSQAIGAGGTLDLSFTECDKPQLVTAYGVPDTDGWHSKLTLHHTLIQGTPPQRLDGPKLKLWLFDLIGLYHTISWASPYHVHDNNHYYYYNRIRSNGHGVYINARQPQPTGEPASTWWEGCTADRASDFKWERYCPLPPWTPADAHEFWASELPRPDSPPLPWAEFCIKLPDYDHRVFPTGPNPMPAVTLVPYYNSRRQYTDPDQYDKGRVPPFEFQVHSEVVESEDGQCQTVAASGNAEGHWATFYDGSKPDAENPYKIGDVKIPQAQYGYFINLRVRGVIVVGTDSEGILVETRPNTDLWSLTFGFKEFHRSVILGGAGIKAEYGSSRHYWYVGPVPRLRTPGDDCSADRQQACALSAPTSTTTPTTAIGYIQYHDDRDWFGATLTQGKRYRVEVVGYAIPNEIRAIESVWIRRIWDPDGVAISVAERGFTNGSAWFTFTAETTGVHHIGVWHGYVPYYRFLRAHMGGYELKLTLLE